MYQECRHIKFNGSRCGSPALHDTPYCYFHTRLHRTARAQPVGPEEPLQLPVLEDRSAIQVALGQVLAGLASARLEPRRASLLLYGLQIASQNVDRSHGIVPAESVHSLSHTSDGEELAPELLVCEGPDDCAVCKDKDTCDDFEEDDDDEEDNDNREFMSRILNAV